MSIFENRYNVIRPWILETVDSRFLVIDKYDIKYIIKIVVLMFIIESRFCNLYVIVIASHSFILLSLYDHMLFLIIIFSIYLLWNQISKNFYIYAYLNFNILP